MFETGRSLRAAGCVLRQSPQHSEAQSILLLVHSGRTGSNKNRAHLCWWIWVMTKTLPAPCSFVSLELFPGNTWSSVLSPYANDGYLMIERCGVFPSNQFDSAFTVCKGRLHILFSVYFPGTVLCPRQTSQQNTGVLQKVCGTISLF